MWLRRTAPIAAVACLVSLRSAAQSPDTVGDVADGNRSIPVHLLKLYDEFDHLITLGDAPVTAYSPKHTCRKCHDYEKIRRGWHFNAADSLVSPGRRGEPWILVDPGAATQIPLSYRSWPGTYRPSEIGMTTFGFLTTFGHHLPGGLSGEKEGETADYMRWQVSGDLDANCQSCHNADPGASQAEYGVQVMRQNFRWAASAGSGFAMVQGSAAEMPDDYDLYSAVPSEKSDMLAPQVSYNPSRFDAAGRVLFNVPRRMSATQCAFCHSSKVIDPSQGERYLSEGDVHIEAGMICVDCHRNGIDHAIIRGYEGEAENRGKGEIARFTCRGCHLGSESETQPLEGRRGAPRPAHLGIPPVHFEKLSCTVCHSGPWPEGVTSAVKTSRAHALGIPKTDKSDDALPQIVTPVFIRQANGTYAPHDVFWPAFWGYENNRTVRPISPARVRPLVASIFQSDTTRSVTRWPHLRESDVVTVLRLLRAQDSSAGEPVYASGGWLYTLTGAGELLRRTGDVSRPYWWPIAHDVRPKAQSLGIRGCTDCHATDAPFYFGTVRVASPFVAQSDSLKAMTEFEERSPLWTWLFSASFLFRPALKVLIVVCFTVIGSVVLLYSFRGLAQLIRMLASSEE